MVVISLTFYACFVRTMTESNQGGGVPNFSLKNPRNFVQPFIIPNHETFSPSPEIPDLNLQLSLGGCYHEFPQEMQFMPLTSFNEDSSGKLPYIAIRSEQQQSKKVGASWKNEMKMRVEKKLRKIGSSSNSSGDGYMGEPESGSASSEEVGKTPLSLPRMVTVEKPPFGVLVPWAAESASKNVALRRALDSINFVGNATYEDHASQGLSAMPTARDRTRPLPQMTVSRVMEKGEQLNLPKNLFEPIMGEKIKLVNMLSETVITSDLGTKGKRCMPFGDALQSDTTNKEKRETPQTSMDIMKRMPTVTTTGGIPCGKKIEGFLFQYY